MRKFIIPLIFAAPLALPAQDLHKDITVEQEVTPSKREATIINILPSVTLPPVSSAPLTYSDKVVTTRVPNTISTLPPIAWSGDAPYRYRGYVVGAVGPWFDAAASLGYAFIDNQRTRLSAWGQFDYDIYRRGLRDDKSTRRRWHDSSASVGIDLHQAIGSKSTLDAGLEYAYGHNDFYASDFASRFSQTVQRVNFLATFTSRHQGLEYDARIGVRHFGFHDCAPAAVAGLGVRPQRQNRFLVSGAGKLETSDCSYLGLSVTADLLDTSRPYGQPLLPYFDIEDDMTLHGSGMTGVVSFTPYYYLAPSTSFSARIGADIDINVKGRKTLRWSPEVTLALTPSQIFGFEVKAKGGTRLNSLADLYSGVTPYLNPLFAYASSHIPYDLQGRLTFGPFFNTTLEVFGGYAKADDWLMPVMSGLAPGGAIFRAMDVKGWRFGASLGYDNGSTWAVKATYTATPGKYKNLWYENRDRARHVLDAHLTLRPLDRLAVDLGFEFRAGRCLYGYGEPENIGNLTYYPEERLSLGAVADLTLGVNYALSRRLNIFARGENLLSRIWYHLSPRPSQPANGLLGFSYKF